MDAAGSSASATRTLAIPVRPRKPHPASAPGVERSFAGLLAARRIDPAAAQPTSRRAVPQAV
jgi:hypothetical protein